MRPVNSPLSSLNIPVAVPEIKHPLLPHAEGEGTSMQPDKKDPPFMGRIFRATANLLSAMPGNLSASQKDNTLLHQAIKQGNLDAVESLLAKHANPNIQDKNGRTPLSYAAEKGHSDIIKALLATPNIQVDKADNKGRTPLSYTAEKGRFDIIDTLLGAHASPNLPDVEGCTPLGYAAQKGHVGAVNALLKNEQTLPDLRGEDGKTPLYHAAAKNHHHVVAALLQDSRVDPNLPDKQGITPLASAVLNSHLNTATTLLKNALVDPNQADEKGYTPLHHVVKTGYTFIGSRQPDKLTMALLDNARIDPNLQEKEHGHTPLAFMILAKNNDARWGRDSVNAMLAHPRIDVNLQDKEGRTPFFLATTRYDDEGKTIHCFKLLLEDPKVKHHLPASNGMTPVQNVLAQGFMNNFPARDYLHEMLKNQRCRDGMAMAERKKLEKMFPTGAFTW